jgi:hypothetical protein
LGGLVEKAEYMPNGFQGSVDEWGRMEAPYIRIDPILAAFATRHALELHKNYRDADRSFRWDNGVSRSIWIASMEKDGASGTYQVSIGAHRDRGSQRHVKHGIVADGVGIDELDDTLERARRILASWSESDLHPARPGGEVSEKL